MGWYTGKSDLLILKIEGEFEGFWGRTTESWEQRYSLEIGKIKFTNKEFPGIKLIGSRNDNDWEHLAEQALAKLDIWEGINKI